MQTKSLNAIARLMEQFTKLPGIGPKSAERITHFLLAAENEQVYALAEALRDIKERVHPCRECFDLTEDELCRICSDPTRDTTKVCVVEQPRDVAFLEKAAVYRGVYHVLQGRIAPLDNIGPEDLTIDALLHRIQKSNIQEVIMATNPTLEGDGTALFLSNLLADANVRITRLARGLPSGSVLEFANSQMVADALQGRQTF